VDHLDLPTPTGPTATIARDRCGLISPYLASTIDAEHEQVGNLKRILTTRLSIGVVVCAIGFAAGKPVWAAGCGAILVVIAVLSVIIPNVLERPGNTRRQIQAMRRNPSPQGAAIIAQTFQEYGEQRLFVPHFSCAMQWAALWVQMEPDNFDALLALGISSADLARMKKTKPKYFSPEATRRIACLSRDAFEAARDCRKFTDEETEFATRHLRAIQQAFRL